MFEQAYAEALYKAVDSGKSPRATVSALHKVLEREGRTALLPRIARAFARIAERESKRDTLTLSISDGASRAKAEAKEVLSAMHVDPRDVEVRKDENLIGGWRLEGREHLYEASYKKHLLSIYGKITQS